MEDAERRRRNRATAPTGCQLLLLGKASLEISDPAADFDGKAGETGGNDSIVKILVDQAQHRFAVPRILIGREWIELETLH